MAEKFLNGWKQIAEYLGRGVRTVQRWEELYGLPVRRPSALDRSAVVAVPKELDEWLKKSPMKGTADERPAFIGKQKRAIKPLDPRSRKALVDGNPLPGTTVLAVDDNDAFRYAIMRTLKLNGFEAVPAANGTEALKLALETKPSLVLLDVNMPDVDGFEVCRKLKANPGTKNIPIIFLSATHKNTSAIERAIEVGAEGFLFSPIDPQQLTAVVLGAVLKYQRQQDSRSIN